MLKKFNLLLFASVIYLLLAIIPPLFSADAVYPFEDKRTAISIKKLINNSGEKYIVSGILPKEDTIFQKERENKMKVIGLLGGMTWVSTVEYYRLANQLVFQELGGYSSAHLILYNVNFAEVEAARAQGRWDICASILTEAAKSLKRAGADFIVLCTNTMHKVADDIEEGSGLPLLHIADVTGEAIKKQGIKKVALLGTKFTMEEDFYRARLKEKFGLEIIVPDEMDREIVHSIIVNELSKNQFKESSKKTYVEIISKLKERGAEGVILGCTEIPLLIGPDDVDIPIFDTTRLHVEAAVNLALGGSLHN
jgi:aspartate racemase